MGFVTGRRLKAYHSHARGLVSAKRSNGVLCGELSLVKASRKTRRCHGRM